MEYVKVVFPTRRRVYIDEEHNGYTEDPQFRSLLKALNGTLKGY